MKKTAILVVLFIIVLIAAGYARADDGARIGIGQSVINSDLKTAEIAYEHNGWDVAATLMESGDTKNGYQDQLHILSVSYITRPQGWGPSWAQPYLRLGVSYNDGSELVGRSNFRLGVGVDFSDVWRVEFSHHSSAGIHSPNTGIDYLTLSYKVPPLW